MRVLGHLVILASVLTACLGAYPQLTMVEVQLGRTVILPCNSSGYSRGELDVHWETMDQMVAFFQEGQLMAGPGYEGRVELQISKSLEGDFSLTLKSAVMSDTDLYVCLAQGVKSLSTVTLTVLPPADPEAHTPVTEGEEVILPCFGKIPKNKPWEKMFIQWLKDDMEILLLSSGEISTNDRDMALLPKESINQGIFSLVIRSVKVSNQGNYRCLYKANDYEAPRNGVPELYTLSIVASLKPGDMSPATEGTNDATTPGPLLFDTTAQDTAKELLLQASPSGEYTWLIADASPDGTTVQDVVGVIPELLPAVDIDTDTSDNRTTVRDTEGGEEEIFEKAPWVRIGIISGVLLVTTVFLGTLMALGKL